MRVLQIGSDRSKRGILYPGSPATVRQEAYGERFDALDIIGFSLTKDGRKKFEISSKTHVYPTNSLMRIFYGLDTIRIARSLPKPDVISAQDPFETGVLGVLVSWLSGAPLYVQLHTDFLAPKYKTHSLLNRLRALCAGFVLRRASRIRVVSTHVKEQLLATYELSAPVTVLPIFVDTARFKDSIHHAGVEVKFSQYKTKLLVVSRLEPEKNVALALHAFIRSASPDACLIVLGEGSELPKLQKIAREFTVEDRVFFEGEQNPGDYYPLADVVLVTSKYEGYGLVIVEALAAGKPVLSTDVGVALEMGALVVREEDFAKELKSWFIVGPKTMELKNYPYKDFDEYVRAYCDDVVACKA